MIFILETLDNDIATYESDDDDNAYLKLSRDMWDALDRPVEIEL